MSLSQILLPQLRTSSRAASAVAQHCKCEFKISKLNQNLSRYFATSFVGNNGCSDNDGTITGGRRRLHGIAGTGCSHSTLDSRSGKCTAIEEIIKNPSTFCASMPISRNMATSTSSTQPRLIAVQEAKRFVTDCFLNAKTPLEHAQMMADLLVEADYRGHFSHGMNRLEMYINDLHKDSTDGGVTPKILKETPATAWVDGQNGLGVVVGNFCMDLAIKKAKTCGVGWVSAKRTNHYGIAGWYTLRAEKQGMIGMSMTNTSPLMSPTRSKEAALGTNPLSLAAPANNGDSFVLDMATTAVAVGKIEMQKRKGEDLPLGWAQDPHGEPTTDAVLGFETACLMPLGGAEISSGYKGYGLGAMVETLCGVLAGSNFSTHVRKWTHAGSNTEANLGQVFIAVDPNCFAPGFTDRMSEMNGILRNMPRTNPDKPVLVAGDPERIHMKKVDGEGGIQYHENQISTCRQLAERLNIPQIRFN